MSADARPHPRDHRHRLPRRREDDADPPLLQNPGGRQAIALIVNEFGDVGLRRRGARRLRRRRLPRRTTSSSWPTAASAAPSPTISCRRWRRCSRATVPPDHIVIETSGLALPQPLVKAFAWPSVQDAGDRRRRRHGGRRVGGGGGARRLRRGEARRAAREGSVARARRSGRGAVRGPAPLRRPDRRSPRPTWWTRRRSRASRRRSPRTRGPRRAASASRTACSPPTSCSGQSAAAEDDSASRKSHHELEGEEHDHDDFDSFVLDGAGRRPRGARARAVAGGAWRSRACCASRGLRAIDGKPAPLAVQAVGPRVETWFARRTRRAGRGWW